jgi:AcrR family transcriptional regulator
MKVRQLPRPATDKRERLVAAANECFRIQAFVSTSIADVARKAKVGPGNVFYYFRTKEDLATAVLERWRSLVAGYADELAEHADPWRRIERSIEQAALLGACMPTSDVPWAGITRDFRRAVPGLVELAQGIYAE